MILNLPAPKSPHKDFRWMVFFFVKAIYTVSKGKTPLIPFFILVHKNFRWRKGEMSPYVPVPRSPQEIKNTLKLMDLPLRVLPEHARLLIRDRNLLHPPVGVNPELAFKRARDYREIIIKLKTMYNKFYIGEIEARYN